MNEGYPPRTQHLVTIPSSYMDMYIESVSEDLLKIVVLPRKLSRLEIPR